MAGAPGGDGSTRPPGIGPHEDCECALMLAGVKPLAMFCDAASVFHHPEEEFAAHVASGRLIRADHDYLLPGCEHIIHCVYYALPGDEWRIEAMRALKDQFYGKPRPWSEDDERVIGRLLGYADWEIEAFIANVRRRTGSR